KDPVALPEQIRKLGSDIQDAFGLLDSDTERAEPRFPSESPQSACVGNQDQIVLILAPSVRALRSQPADNNERDILNANDFSNWINIFPEKAGGRGAAEKTNLAGGPNVIGGEVITTAEPPSPDSRIVLAYAPNAH